MPPDARAIAGGEVGDRDPLRRQAVDGDQLALRELRDGDDVARAAQRLSRLVLLANDGAERFYHDAASLLARNADRTWGCLIDATATELGRSFTAKGGPAKALMINDKTALGLFLTTLAQRL